MKGRAAQSSSVNPESFYLRLGCPANVKSKQKQDAKFSSKAAPSPKGTKCLDMGPASPGISIHTPHLLLGGCRGSPTLGPQASRGCSALGEGISWTDHPALLGPPPLACLSPCSLPPSYSSEGRTGQRPLSATPSRPTCTPPRAPTPAARPQSSNECRAL